MAEKLEQTREATSLEAAPDIAKKKRFGGGRGKRRWLALVLALAVVSGGVAWKGLGSKKDRGGGTAGFH